MMYRTIVLLTMLVSAGCSADTPTSPSAALDGVWRILSIQPSSQAAQTAPVGAQYQIGFEDSRVVVRVDCNTCSGPFTANGSTLTVGPTLACTRAACATASYESAVVALLSGEHQMTATLHNLTLRSSRGTIELQQ